MGCQKISLKTHKLKKFSERQIFFPKSLIYEEIQVEEILLLKREELINSGIQQRKLEIRNLKVYKDGNQIQVGRND